MRAAMHLCISVCPPAVLRAPIARNPTARSLPPGHSRSGHILAATPDQSSQSLICLRLKLCNLLQPSKKFQSSSTVQDNELSEAFDEL